MQVKVCLCVYKYNYQIIIICYCFLYRLKMSFNTITSVSNMLLFKAGPAAWIFFYKLPITFSVDIEYSAAWFQSLILPLPKSVKWQGITHNSEIISTLHYQYRFGD